MNGKVTQEIFDRVKQIVETYPEMKATDIAQMLCGGGYTKRQLSKTTIYYLKKASSFDEYNEISNSSRRKRRKNKAIKPQCDLADELMADPDEKDEFEQAVVDALLGKSDDKHDEKEESCESKTANTQQQNEESIVEAISKLMNIYVENAFTRIRSMNQEKTTLLTDLLIAKGTNGYQDETIANKVQNVASGCGSIKKEMKNCFDVVFEGQQNLYTSSSIAANNLDAISRLLKTAFDDFSKELASLHGIGNESADFIEDISSIVNRIFAYSAVNDEKLSNIEKGLETTNLLLQKIINLWEPSSNNAEI